MVRIKLQPMTRPNFVPKTDEKAPTGPCLDERPNDHSAITAGTAKKNEKIRKITRKALPPYSPII